MALARTSDTSFVSQSLLRKKTPHKGVSFLAQRRGFEPPVRFRRTHDFQSCSLNHSDISAYRHFCQAPIYITVFFEKMQAFLIDFIKNLQKSSFLLLRFIAIAKRAVFHIPRITALFTRRLGDKVALFDSQFVQNGCALV